MRLALVAIIGALVCVGLAGPALAHNCCCHRDHEYGCYGCDHYVQPPSQTGPQSRNSGPSNWVANLKTVEGKIVEVVYLPGATPETGVVDVRILTGAGANLIRLAPSGFLKQGGLHLQEGDSVVIKAFPVDGMNGETMVATEVQGNGVNVRLRGSSGQPLW